MRLMRLGKSGGGQNKCLQFCNYFTDILDIHNQMAAIMFEKFIYHFSGKTVGSLFWRVFLAKLAPLKRYYSFEKLFYCALY